jgi:hypothetical protein
VQVSSHRGRFAERILHGVDAAGNDERVVIWIERREGGIWVVGRSVDEERRHGGARPREDTILESYELDEVLDRANEALEDDLTVSEGDGRGTHCKPFTRNELLKPLEAWFFGRK